MLKLLLPIDCVKDRLASFFHWDDRQALEQAFLVTRNHSIDIKNLKQWAKTEGTLKNLINFYKCLKNINKLNSS